jgi:cytochrome c553
MARTFFIAGVAIALLASPLPLRADVAAGKASFDKACKSCHGAEGKGNPAIAKMMKVELRALGSKEVQAKADAELTKEISDGTGKMKGIKSLSAGDVKSVVEFVRTLKN